MTLGLNPFVAMASVGFLAVFFYRQGRRELSIEEQREHGLARWADCSGLPWRQSCRYL